MDVEFLKGLIQMAKEENQDWVQINTDGLQSIVNEIEQLKRGVENE